MLSLQRMCHQLTTTTTLKCVKQICRWLDWWWETDPYVSVCLCRWLKMAVWIYVIYTDDGKCNLAEIKNVFINKEWKSNLTKLNVHRFISLVQLDKNRGVIVFQFYRYMYLRHKHSLFELLRTGPNFVCMSEINLRLYNVPLGLGTTNE